MALEMTTNMQRAIAMADQLGVKFSTTHVEGVNWLWEAAEDYVKQYRGSFDYMLKLQDGMRRYRRLGFANQVSGALNCLMVEVRKEREAQKVAQVEIDFSQVPSQGGSSSEPVEAAKRVPSGYWTVQFEDGKHITIRVTHKGDWTRFAYLSGSDNESSYTQLGYSGKDGKLRGCTLKSDTHVMVAYGVLTGASNEQMNEFGKAYAMASGRCYRCGRLLTEPESIRVGIGPICRGL